MNEFEEKDYAGARSYADAIQTNANNIMSIFDDIDATMTNLYGANWESSGAEDAKSRYKKKKKNYEVFYQRVIAMRNHIYSVTAANEAADAAASQNIANV